MENEEVIVERKLKWKNFDEVDICHVGKLRKESNRKFAGEIEREREREKGGRENGRLI